MNKATFTPGADGKTLVMERDFDASRDRVWDAWTKSEILDQWWGPAPWKAVTKSMEFKVGGTWLYYMEGPSGERHYALLEYLEINPKESFSGRDSFADENGNPSDTIPSNIWLNEFMGDDNKTHVTVTINFHSPESMKTMMEMGMKEGFTQGLDQLETLLQK